MYSISKVTTSTPYKSRLALAALCTCLFAGGGSLAGPERTDSLAAEISESSDNAQVAYTSWYLRINEYLFEGRDRKKFIAVHVANNSASALPA